MRTVSATHLRVQVKAITCWSDFASSQEQQGFALSALIDAEQAEENYEGGILIITFPQEGVTRRGGLAWSRDLA
ncbi:MAG TPA: hypothetical protein VFV38_50940 [Ktedonobacteraceae bacterium]|nr:hypothetical protein [Ktedonobacteraceae bacterium]